MANISNSLVFMAINYYEADLGKTHKTTELNPCYLSNTHTHIHTNVHASSRLIICLFLQCRHSREYAIGHATQQQK